MEFKKYINLPYNPLLKERAKELRKARNMAEVIFWQHVRNKSFKGFDFDRQKIIGNYIVDFFCLDRSVVIEIDGSSHNDKNEYDTQRNSYLKGLGLTVIHISAEDIEFHIHDVFNKLYNHPALI